MGVSSFWKMCPLVVDLNTRGQRPVFFLGLRVHGELVQQRSSTSFDALCFAEFLANCFGFSKLITVL